MDDQYILMHIGICLLRKYDPDDMDFLKWLNCLDYMYELLKIKDEDRAKFLLHMMEPPVYTTIIDTLSPFNPLEIPYDELIYALMKMFSFFEGEEAANYRFLVRDQLPMEPVQHYVLALRKLLSKCSPMIKRADNLKDRFIDGLENEETKAYLKQRSEDMTFALVVGTAKQIELAKKEYKCNFD